MEVEKIKKMKYRHFVKHVKKLNANEIVKLSNKIGYPVFTRMCMGELNHKIVLLQDGAAAIVENNDGQILLQSRIDRELWGLPGGCQELGESFRDTIIREVKEEAGLDIKKSDLKLIDVVSGITRTNFYPNGDVVINNTVLFYINNYDGSLNWNTESKEMKFFSMNSLPENLMDRDLIKTYLEKVNEN